jgi:SAM-dependent methyltransferase
MSHGSFEKFLVCPECRSALEKQATEFVCTGGCNCRYPVYFNVPIMISCRNRIFTPSDFVSNEPPDIFFKQYKNPVIRILQKLRPDVTLNLASKKNYKKIAETLAGKKDCRILIIGGSIDGSGIDQLKQHLPADTVLVESDVAHGPNTNIIFDSHQVPFSDSVFDLVVVQAVLEHVLDPFACVEEIYRVLKPDGMIYAETPFMQQVHGGKYDFHRFTHLGHRRLFRKFEEKDSGLVAGAGSGLAWSLRYFILSFAPNKKIDKALSYGSSFLVFWLKYFDYILNTTRGSFDSACGYYFWGKKTQGYILSDETLLSQYKGFRSGS